MSGAESRAESAENRVSWSGAVIGRDREYGGAGAGAWKSRSGSGRAEDGAGVTEEGVLAKWLFRRSHSAHML